ncbi:hypothetical protein HJG60_009051 [Phyllostomus discolor]|uniref:Uncharacterized protein n=1 Tax=Phyllostomus discolor TaxID=89673 RepID=A0A834DFP7_9CHIR|nr:hypothetical protein HJG60_009051 [Phyllostomus discolor]
MAQPICDAYKEGLDPEVPVGSGGKSPPRCEHPRRATTRCRRRRPLRGGTPGLTSERAQGHYEGRDPNLEATRPPRRSPGHRITRAAQAPKPRKEARNLQKPHPTFTFFQVYTGCLVSVLIARALARPAPRPARTPPRGS